MKNKLKKNESTQNESIENKSTKNEIWKMLLTSSLITAIITTILTGTFNIIISHNESKNSNQIEMQKLQFDLDKERYTKLQESLEYFAKFQVYDAKFIYKFDVSSSDYNLEVATDMMHTSLEEFCTNLYLLNPYLSDKALEILDKEIMSKDEIIKKYDVNIKDVMNDKEVNSKMKEHFEDVNKEFDRIVSVIIRVITDDIYCTYVSPER